MVKLYHLLKQLAPSELPHFEQFLASPYFNASPYPLPLFQYLKPHHPGYELLDREALARQVFPERAENRLFINQRFSELSRLVESFLTVEVFQKQPHLRAKAQRIAFSKRDMYPTFKKSCQKQLEALGKPENFHAQDFLVAFETYTDLYDYPSEKTQAVSVKEFDQLTNHLDFFLISEKLKCFCDFYAQQVTFPREDQLRMVDAVLEAASQLKDQYVQIELFYELTLLLQQKAPYPSLERVYQLFITKGELLSKTDQALFLQKLVTVLNIKLNDDRKYIALLFELYQYGDLHQLLIHFGMITDITFFNVCSVGGFQGAFDWTMDFIQRYSPYLLPATSQEATLLAQALLLFHQEKYQEAYQFTQQIPKRGIHYKWRIRTLHVRCLLASHIQQPNYLKTVLSGVAAFRQLLSRDPTFSERRLQQYHAFCKMAAKLARLRTYDWRNKKAKAAYRQELEDVPIITLRPWLLKLLEEDGKDRLD